MNRYSYRFGWILLVVLSMSVWADRPLKASETESLRQLTASPGSWMESGTVTRHLEYHREEILCNRRNRRGGSGPIPLEIVIETEEAVVLSAPAEAETKSRFAKTLPKPPADLLLGR